MATTYTNVPLPRGCRVGFGSQVKRTAKVLSNNFGDGYVQRAADGINNVRKTYSVTISNLTVKESQALDDFFAGLAGWRQFYYQQPGRSSPDRYICSEWSITHSDAMIDSMTCSWTQVFT